MKSISAADYNIDFNENGYDSLHRILEQNTYSKIIILVDENTSTSCLPPFLESLSTTVAIEIIEIESGEEHKTIETCAQLWTALTELGADRKSVLINLGGGVITDLGGFLASTYKRGIDFINIPTTLLAMVDAAIGGKNGVDLGNLKNQIGTITNPKMVLIDTHFLETLPQNQMRSGLAEMLKHGLILDQSYWNQFLNLSQLDTTDLPELIYRSVEIKNKIVLQDPTEKGIRKSLNFGHTLGHAIESYFLEKENRATLLHGEAIAIGMILESYISFELKLLSFESFLEIKTVLLSLFGIVEISPEDQEFIINLLVHDKKNEYGKIQFVLLEQIGKVKINQEVPTNLILNAFKNYAIP